MRGAPIFGSGLFHFLGTAAAQAPPLAGEYAPMMARWPRFQAFWLPGLALYVSLACLTAREVGLVGEVAIGWGTSVPPRVLAQLDPAEILAPAPWGPLVASQTRPVERLVVGDLSVPIAVNAYTGGLSDLPARCVNGALGWRTGAWAGVGLGAILLLLASRFVRIHAGELPAGLVAVLLGSDWSFVFYKRVLSGTEVLLQAGALLTVWAIWSRRWRGGVHGTLGITLGIAFGLEAKVTFVCTLLAIGLAALVTRWDRPAVGPPAPLRVPVLALGLVGLLPVVLAAVHAAQVPAALLVHSHDTLGLQLSRIQASSDMARESWRNVIAFTGNPNAFWGWALGASEVPALSPGRLLGLGVLAAGTALGWSGLKGAPSPSDALLRFLSVLCPLQTLFLFFANHDLHHLAQSSVFWGMWMALAISRVAATFGRARSLKRALTAGLFASPVIFAGADQLLETDVVLSSAPQSTFRESGQRAIVTLLEQNHVERLVTSDYEVYGMIDVRAPKVEITHTWAAFSRKVKEPWRVLSLARGGHYLALRPTTPMIYNWSPTPDQVRAAAVQAGVTVTGVGELRDGAAVWASLWQVD